MFKSKKSHKVPIVSFTAGILLATGLFLLIGGHGVTKSPRPASTAIQELTVNQLLTMPEEEELASIDIALMNLVCAEGLKGSECLNVSQSLSILEDWTEIVRNDTQLRIQAFRQNPGKYDNSENLFNLVNMVLCLKNEIGVDYNQEIMRREEFPDSRDVFIHGCLAGQKQGGCISIPILCVSVGRRLGYPLKLVLTKRHVFFRWEDGKEVFNMEACCPGCDSHPDDYYRTWPDKIDDATVRADMLLKSLTPSEELALSLETRGHCLFDMGQAAEAQICYAHAYKRMPTRVKLAYFDQVIKSELKKMRDRQ